MSNKNNRLNKAKKPPRHVNILLRLSKNKQTRWGKLDDEGKINLLIQDALAMADAQELIEQATLSVVETSIRNSLSLDFEGNKINIISWRGYEYEIQNIKIDLKANLNRFNSARAHMEELLVSPPELTRVAMPSDPIKAAAEQIVGRSQSKANQADEVIKILNKYKHANLLDIATIDAIHRDIYKPKPGEQYREQRSPTHSLFLPTPLGRKLFEDTLAKLSGMDVENLGDILFALIIAAHPYADGNGRTARVLYALSQLKKEEQCFMALSGDSEIKLSVTFSPALIDHKIFIDSAEETLETEIANQALNSNNPNSTIANNQPLHTIFEAPEEKIEPAQQEVEHEESDTDENIAAIAEQAIAASLHIAVWDDNLEAVKALINHPGCNPNIMHEDGWAALHIAAEKGNREMLQALLNHSDCNPKIKDKNGWTALRIAVHKGHAEIVQSLVNSQRCDLNEKDRNGFSLHDIAVYQGHAQIAAIFTPAKQHDLPATSNAAEVGVEQVLGAEVTRKDLSRKTPNRLRRFTNNYVLGRDDEDKPITCKDTPALLFGGALAVIAAPVMVPVMLGAQLKGAMQPRWPEGMEPDPVQERMEYNAKLNDSPGVNLVSNMGTYLIHQELEVRKARKAYDKANDNRPVDEADSRRSVRNQRHAEEMAAFIGASSTVTVSQNEKSHCRTEAVRAATSTSSTASAFQSRQSMFKLPSVPGTPMLTRSIDSVDRLEERLSRLRCSTRLLTSPDRGLEVRLNNLRGLSVSRSTPASKSRVEKRSLEPTLLKYSK